MKNSTALARRNSTAITHRNGADDDMTDDEMEMEIMERESEFPSYYDESPYNDDDDDDFDNDDYDDNDFDDDEEEETGLVEQAEEVADILGVEANTVVISSLDAAEVEDALAEYINDNDITGETNIVISMPDDGDDDGNDNGDFHGVEIPIHFDDDLEPEELNSYVVSSLPMDELAELVDEHIHQEHQGEEVAAYIGTMHDDFVRNGASMRNGITLEQAKNLRTGQTLEHYMNVNADGTPQRWKVTSVKTWKRSPERVEIGVKHGLYSYDKLTERDLYVVNLPDGQRNGMVGHSKKNFVVGDKVITVGKLKGLGVAIVVNTDEYENTVRIRTNSGNIIDADFSDLYLADSILRTRPTRNGVMRNAAVRSPKQSVLVHGYERDSPYGYEHEVNDYYRALPNEGNSIISKATARKRTAEQKANRYSFWSKQGKASKPKSMKNGASEIMRNGSITIDNSIVKKMREVSTNTPLRPSLSEQEINNAEKAIARFFRMSLAKAFDVFGLPYVSHNVAEFANTNSEVNIGNGWHISGFIFGTSGDIIAHCSDYESGEKWFSIGKLSGSRNGSTKNTSRNGVRDELNAIINTVKQTGVLSQAKIDRACNLAESLKMKNGVLQNKVDAALNSFKAAVKRNGAKAKKSSQRKNTKGGKSVKGGKR